MNSLVDEIRERLAALAGGGARAEGAGAEGAGAEGAGIAETARWAVGVMEADDPVWRDDAVWCVLERLADAPENGHGPAHFAAWLGEFDEEYPGDGEA
jgi:hypothetical protein